MGLLLFRLQGLLSLKSRDAVLEEDEAVEQDEGTQAWQAHREILCTVAPSFRFYRFGELEDI